MYKQLFSLAFVAALVACSQSEDSPVISPQGTAAATQSNSKVENSALNLANSKLEAPEFNEKTDSLVRAIYEYDTKSIAELLSSGTNLNALGTDKNTPLIAAIKKDIPEVVNALLENGANPDLSAPDSAPPLFVAVEKSRSEYALALLSHKANPKIIFDGVDIARFCVMQKNLGVLQRLVEAGADVKKLDSLGISNVSVALEHAVDMETLDYLISKGVSGSARDLDRVIGMGEEPRVLLLLKNSEINPNAEIGNDGQSKQLGNSLLSHAIQHNQMAVAKELVSRGADGTDAFAANMKDENLSKISFLLDKKIVNLSYQYMGENPLIYVALEDRQFKIANALIKAGVDIGLRGNGRISSRHLFCLVKEKINYDFSLGEEDDIAAIANSIIKTSKEKNFTCPYNTSVDMLPLHMVPMNDLVTTHAAKRKIYKVVLSSLVEAGWINLDKVRNLSDVEPQPYLCSMAGLSGHVPLAELKEYADLALKLGASAATAATCPTTRNPTTDYSQYLAKITGNH